MRSNRSRTSRAWPFAALLLPLALTLSGCRDDSSKSAPEGAGAPKPEAKTETKAAPAAVPLSTIKQKPPAVPNAAEAKKYAGTKISFYGDSVGINAELDKVMAAQFKEETGIEINVIPRPKDATESYSTYLRLFQAKSADIDVLMIDVIWTGAFAPHLADLGPKLGEAAKQHVESIVKNNTVGGSLIALPWYTDFGMLYYRTDLLQKAGFTKPPETWDELEQMAKKIQDGEKATNTNFVGYVWQGKAYEGLTCDAIEWIASHGGGSIVDDGKVTVNNPQTQKALSRARGWVGSISPAGVTGYEEEDARNVFQAGNAAFMRNWPYAYAAGNDEKSAVKGKFDVAPLPHEPGQKSAGAVGGWQLAVSKFSKNQDAAIEFVRYLGSPEGQKFRALVASVIPTIPSVQADPEVQKALPFMERMKGLSLVTRPSNATGDRYNEVSIAFFQGVSQALQGKPPAEVLPQIQQRIERAIPSN